MNQETYRANSFASFTVSSSFHLRIFSKDFMDSFSLWSMRPLIIFPRGICPACSGLIPRLVRGTTLLKGVLFWSFDR